LAYARPESMLTQQFIKQKTTSLRLTG